MATRRRKRTLEEALAVQKRHADDLEKVTREVEELRNEAYIRCGKIAKQVFGDDLPLGKDAETTAFFRMLLTLYRDDQAKVRVAPEPSSTGAAALQPNPFESRQDAFDNGATAGGAAPSV